MIYKSKLEPSLNAGVNTVFIYSLAEISSVMSHGVSFIR